MIEFSDSTKERFYKRFLKSKCKSNQNFQSVYFIPNVFVTLQVFTLKISKLYHPYMCLHLLPLTSIRLDALKRFSHRVDRHDTSIWYLIQSISVGRECVDSRLLHNHLRLVWYLWRHMSQLSKYVYYHNCILIKSQESIE